jgi:uroporphyrinogen-III decarboxylase
MNARGCREPRARYSEEFRNSGVHRRPEIAFKITLLLLALYHFAAAVLYRYVVPTMDEM